MSRHTDHRRTPDPLSLLTQSMRRMSSLRLEDITRGLENFANPSARGMLESMGRTREEQVATMVEMLRNSTEEEIAEMGQVFGEAMARLAEERGRAEAARPPEPAPDRRSPRRAMSAAEWRRQRRLAS